MSATGKGLGLAASPVHLQDGGNEFDDRGDEGDDGGDEGDKAQHMPLLQWESGRLTTLADESSHDVQLLIYSDWLIKKARHRLAVANHRNHTGHLIPRSMSRFFA
jgi:hypothetical protein